MYTDRMKTTALLTVALLLGVAAPAWADGYMSRYHSYGGQYLSGYHTSGYYYGGHGGGYVYYGGPYGSIERKHSADWERRQDAAMRRRLADIEPSAGPSWARGVYNPMGIALGKPRGSREICGTYLRKPALCTTSTMRYDPYVHGN